MNEPQDREVLFGKITGVSTLESLTGQPEWSPVNELARRIAEKRARRDADQKHTKREDLVDAREAGKQRWRLPPSHVHRRFS